LEYFAVDPASPKSYTSFDGHRYLATGPLPVVALAVKRAVEAQGRMGTGGPVLIFEDATGRSIDVDTRSAVPIAEEPKVRGRPKLGVVPREVTLLPRHWEWLATQPGGASVALRKLVETARRAHAGQDERRQAQERAYHFMSAMAGDLPGFEEAARALFAADPERFAALVSPWPADVRDYASTLAGFSPPASS
jgi:hypothetical protein